MRNYLSQRKFDIASWLSCGACISIDSNSLLVSWGARSWTKSSSDITYSYYAPDFFLKKSHPWFQHEHNALISLEDLNQMLSHAKILWDPKFSWNPVQTAPFHSAYNELQSLFKAEKLQKAVIYAAQSGMGNFDVNAKGASFRSLLKTQKTFPSFTYGFWDDAMGILGSTPEVLFSVPNKGNLFTMACAGTQDRGLPVDLLKNDPKSFSEHQCVIDGIKESLSPFGSVTVGQRFTVDLPKIRHLVTPIQVSLSAVHKFEDLVRSLHPTPALGAFPKKFGEDWLKNYDVIVPRGRFGAPFGYFDPSTNKSICYVAIRNVQWENDNLLLLAGCGVVKTSKYADEKQELCLKLQTIRHSIFGCEENDECIGPEKTVRG